ncbi:MAG: membrane dipeptidase [Kofleriaceae bacterium]|nr:membrane dipeptidase [Kofleriaceae bacterium]
MGYSAEAQAGNANRDCGNTKINNSGADIIYQSLNDNGPGKIGPRRLVVNQSGTIRSMTTRLFVQATGNDIDTMSIKLRKTGGKAKTSVTICSTDSRGQKRILHQFEVGKGKKTTGQIWDKRLSGIKGKRISVRLVGKNAVNTMSYSLEFNRPNRGRIRNPNQRLSGAARSAVVGHADLHNHHSSRFGFGGGVVAGSFSGNTRFPTCSHNHSRKKGFTAGLVVKSHPKEGIATASTPRTYKTGNKHVCTTTPGQPTRCWSDTTHQKMSKPALKLAHENGLQLMVTHVVSNQGLCYLAAPLKDRDNHCSDMESAKLQIRKLKEFAAANTWYTIVTDPWQARRAIAKGELAVVIGLEVSNIFPSSDGNYIKQLHDVYDMGASVVYLAHESDSEFAGAAYHHWPTLFVNQELKLLKNAFSGNGHGALARQLNSAHRGKLGHNPTSISSKGRRLVQEMMKLHMLIDIDHLSRPSSDAVYSLAKANSYYPLFAGHTRVQSLLDGKTKKETMELVGNKKIFDYISDTGGMLGLRAGPDEIKGYGRIANDCAGSVKSFLQTYQWLVDKGYSVAFGTDLNGYVPMLAPRWGPDACPLANSRTRASQKTAQGRKPIAPQGAPTGWQLYAERGLVDIGALASVLFDMKSLGANTAPLERSAESFLKMWQRTYDANRRKHVRTQRPAIKKTTPKGKRMIRRTAPLRVTPRSRR